ncbi:MAG: ABC transporter substrate-binding protein [Acetobacteraceae bacterium]|nr:MAG: ABC transporter substrate-binding protein [Acetobacteraceae bacterium]
MAQDARPSITVAVQKIANSNTLDVARENSNVGTRHFACYTEPLVDTDWITTLQPRPGLALRWTRLDARRVEVELRPGVRFHNGDEMVAEDVAASFGPERLMGGAAGIAARVPQEVRAQGRAVFPGLTVEVLGRHRLRFVTEKPDPALDKRLGHRIGIVVNRRALEEAGSWLEWARKPIGTGPYRVAEFRPDTALLLEAFDDYWGGRPPLRRIRFLEVPEVSARIAGLLSGEYDFACDIPPDQIGEIERNRGFEVQGGLIANHRFIAFDKTHPQLVDPRVRRALSLSIDRASIIEGLWAGRTEVPRGMQFPFYGGMYLEDWPQPRFDLAEARALVKASGYRGDAIPYRLLNNYYTAQTPTAQVLVENWRAAGLNVKIEMRENWNQVLAPGPDRALRDWSSTVFIADPVSNMPGVWGRHGAHPAGGEWANEEAFAAVEALESEMDTARRRAAMRRLLGILENEDPAYAMLHQAANFTGKRRAIRWRAAQSFLMDFRAGNWDV